MSITGMDHFTLLTRDATLTADFYNLVLGLEIGPRPAFKVPGVWLYCDGAPILHVLERDEIPGAGVFDHIAFRGSGLSAFIANLKARRIAYDLRRFPDGGPSAGAWQLFLIDPNGARVEIDFPKTEPDPRQSK